MRVLVLDSRNGNETSDLYVVDPDTRRVRTLQLNYSPEIAYDSATNQLLVVETELDVAKRGRGSLYWLKLYDARNLKLIRQAETPPRPMYAGFPNRSTKVVASASGRYVYFQVLQVHPERTDIYRVRPGRFDRVTNGIETGLPAIDSCVVDFGPAEGSEHELFFHLACDMPNTVAFMRFDSPEIDTVVVAELASRAFSIRNLSSSPLIPRSLSP